MQKRCNQREEARNGAIPPSPQLSTTNPQNSAHLSSEARKEASHRQPEKSGTNRCRSLNTLQRCNGKLAEDPKKEPSNSSGARKGPNMQRRVDSGAEAARAATSPPRKSQARKRKTPYSTAAQNRGQDPPQVPPSQRAVDAEAQGKKPPPLSSKPPKRNTAGSRPQYHR